MPSQPVSVPEVKCRSKDQKRFSSEIVLSQNLDDAPVRQDAKFAAGSADVALKLQAQVEAWPMVAQFEPPEATVVAGVKAKVSRQIKILHTQAFLSDIDQVCPPGRQLLQPQRFTQIS